MSNNQVRLFNTCWRFAVAHGRKSLQMPNRTGLQVVPLEKCYRGHGSISSDPFWAVNISQVRSYPEFEP